MKQLVKTLSILLIFTLAACSPFRYLPAPDEVPDSYRKEYKENQKALKDIYRDNKDWDIVLDPVEQVPTQEFSARGISGITNWGEQTLLPGDLRNRIRQECRYPVLVRILDTAADYDHKDLQKGKVQGKNYSGDGTDVDVNGHSTHVAGIIYGQGFGLAWDLADLGLLRVQPLEVLQDAGRGSFTWVAQAINDNQRDDFDRIRDGESVIYNGSLGGGSSLVGSVEDALKASTREGVYFVFASGNNGSYVEYPGKSEYTLATAALTQSLKKASFSSPGPEVFWAMPGVSIQSTYRNNTYASLSGTSMASPFATAGLAIALSKWGREALPNYATIKKYSEWVCTDIDPAGKDNLTGWGIAYVSSILDKDPADMENPPSDPPTDPEPDPDPDPTPERPYAVDYTFDLGGYTVVWNRQNEKERHTLELTNIRFTIPDTKKPFDKVEADIKAKCESFFRNRGLILLDHHDQWDATYWAIRFLYMLRFKDVDIETVSVTSQDKKTKAVIYRDDIMSSMVELVPTQMDYIDIQSGQIRSLEGPKKEVLRPIPQNVYTYEVNNVSNER